MLEMADNQFAITAGQQPVEEHDRVATAGNAHQVTPVVRQKLSDLVSPLLRWQLFHDVVECSPPSPSQGKCRLTTRRSPKGSIAFLRMCSRAASTESVT